MKDIKDIKDIVSKIKKIRKYMRFRTLKDAKYYYDLVITQRQNPKVDIIIVDYPEMLWR